MAAKKEKKPSLAATAREMIRLAEEGGVEQNYFFRTTFERYKLQLKTLQRLKKEIEGKDLIIEKEYVKGRPNLTANPAIGEYNKTATAANQTVQTLIKIIQTFTEGTILGAASGDDECDL